MVVNFFIPHICLNSFTKLQRNYMHWHCSSSNLNFYYCFCFLQFAGVDSLQAGNVVQLVLVLGLTVGWISTYIFRVSNKEMTYAQQLRDYENKVMQVQSVWICLPVSRKISTCL